MFRKRYSNHVRLTPAPAGMAVLAGATLVWIGMILGVPFLATSAKFLAPSLSLPVALDVGRHTFEIFLIVEAVWASLIAGLVILLRPRRPFALLGSIAVVIVLLDTVWLRPALDARVQTILDGGMPEPSNLHLLYVALELVKLFALLALGTLALRHLAKNAGQ